MALSKAIMANWTTRPQHCISQLASQELWHPALYHDTAKSHMSGGAELNGSVSNIHVNNDIDTGVTTILSMPWLIALSLHASESITLLFRASSFKRFSRVGGVSTLTSWS